jgi:hypothetical protein
MAIFTYLKKKFLAPLVSNQDGQITIFFAVAMIIIVTLLTFVVNVGLFVKAKINLQNATDAAAWSGAATQARQLTDIAYMNWEMRNVYKEWMFKYYVLGNLSAKGVRTPGTQGNNNYVTGSSNVMDFTIGPNNSIDRYNFPSVCIHPRVALSGNTSIQGDICSIYKIPGLPRLSFGFSSIDQTTATLTDALAQNKAKDCAARSIANFNVTRAWIYGTGSNKFDAKILETAPHVAVNRMGAWVKAIEIAHRIRNMEFIVNTPAQSNLSFEAVADLEQQNFAGNERAIKAYYSAYRNLGNDTSYGIELKKNFRLTEISPQTKEDGDAASLSNLFIPRGGGNFEKTYLDLKAIPLNFVNFFTTLIPLEEKAPTANDTATAAGCQVSRIAFPVPGYILGFTKNPEVLTYYVVKGEAEFTGLFNPLGRGITLTAYAAAKPFGGRIGPALFNNFSKNALSSVLARTDVKKRSLHYAMGLSIAADQIGQSPYPPIIPSNNDLWVTNSNDVIGGSTNNTSNLKYVVPNLIYQGVKAPPSSTTNSAFFIYRMPAQSGANTPYGLGLYDVAEFKSFSDNIGSLNGIIEAETVDTALSLIRSPTAYDKYNYLIPTQDKINNELQVDTLGLGKAGNDDEFTPLYAPLYGDNLLYPNAGTILNSIKLFLAIQRPAIETFVDNLYRVSNDIRSTVPVSATSGIEVYKEAANFFYNAPSKDNSQINCASMAGQFLYYFFEAESQIKVDATCSGHTSLPRALEEIYSNSAPPDVRMHRDLYFLDLPLKGDEANARSIFTAFTPGKYSGAVESNSSSEMGNIPNPFLQVNTLSLRNFYSTKLVSIQSLINATDQSYDKGFALMSEGSYTDTTGQDSFQNPINLVEANNDIFQ